MTNSNNEVLDSTKNRCVICSKESSGKVKEKPVCDECKKEILNIKTN